MPDIRTRFRLQHNSLENRFLTWVDRLVEPGNATPPSPDPDFADVAETATTVHRAVGIDSTTPLSTERAEAMWENLMHSTTMTATPVPHPDMGNDPPSPPAGSARSLPAPQPGWRSYLMTAALIAAIVVASIATIWRITDPLNRNGPDVANQPGFLASATPAAESADGCPLTSDMLIFNGEAPPFEDIEDLAFTVAIVQPDGDFLITCAGVDDSEPLVTGVGAAIPLLWPGAVLLHMEDGSAIAYNVATGKQVALGGFALAGGMFAVGQAPSWLASPNNAALTDWRITNLERMTTFVLSDELGGVLEKSQTITIETSYGSPTAMISFDESVEPLGLPPYTEIEDIPTNADDAVTAELPNSALVVDDTFETRRWIDAVGQTAVSPEGQTIAYQTEIDSAPTLRVEDARSGDVLAEFADIHIDQTTQPSLPEFGDISFDRTSQSFMAFAGDGESLVYLERNDVWLVDYRGEPARTLLETGDMRPDEIHATGVPGRLLIERIIAGNIGSPSAGPVLGLSILDTTSDEIVDVEGELTGYNYGIYEAWEQLEYVVTMLLSPESASQTVMQVTDIRSGELVLTSEPVQTLAAPQLSVTSDRTGAVTVVNGADGAAMYLDVVTGTVETLATDRFEAEASINWFVLPSTDGQFFYALGTEGVDVMSPSEELFSMAVTSGNPEWSIPSEIGPSGIILGIASPEGDVPATLEAQDITPLEASPSVIPATPDTD